MTAASPKAGGPVGARLPGGFDPRRLRAQFPIFDSNPGLVFLDSGASAQKPAAAIDRVADSTGIPIEDSKAESTADIRAALGINQFAQARGEVADPRDRTGVERI